jgi:hypothetical protein
MILLKNCLVGVKQQSLNPGKLYKLCIKYQFHSLWFYPIGTRTTLETSTITNLSGNYVLQRPTKGRVDLLVQSGPHHHLIEN